MTRRILWLSGMPRSGTTWLSQVFAASPDVRVKFCPLFSYLFKNALDENSSPEQWLELFEQAYGTQDEYMDQEYLRKQGLVPRFNRKNTNPPVLLIKSTRFHHLIEGMLNKCPDLTLLCLVRHPCACIASWLNNPLEFPTWANAQEQWRVGACRKDSPGEFWGFDDWKWVTRMQLRLARAMPERVLLLRYEELLKDPHIRIEDLFNRLGLEYCDQTKDFIQQSTSRHDGHRRSVYKDRRQLDHWRNTLRSSIAQEILDELDGSDLAAILDDVG